MGMALKNHMFLTFFGTIYLSTQAIHRPPQSRETIPLMLTAKKEKNLSVKKSRHISDDEFFETSRLCEIHCHSTI
jgi:hypothetical protein